MSFRVELDIVSRLDSTLSLDMIAKEPWIQQIETKAGEQQFDVDMSFVDELNNIMNKYNHLHKAGKPRIPQIKKVSDIVMLQDLYSQCLGDKGRVTEVSMSCKEILSELGVLADTCKLAFFHYSAVRSLKNDDMRRTYYSAVAPILFERIRQIDLVVDLANEVKTHLSDMHFSLHEVVKLSERLLDANNKF